MEIQTFWKIVLKGIGLWLFVSCLYMIPQLLLLFENDYTEEFTVTLWAVSLLTFLIYIIFVVLFLFKSEWLAYQFKLSQNFSESRIELNIPSDTILRIIAILTGALVFMEAFPNLIQQIFQFIQQQEFLRNYSMTSWLIMHFIRALFGFLLMTNSKIIVKYLNKNSNRNG